uniref:Uncharacterized protein n=1 Tax=Ditylenchus dipsaci TaxID=166011 RepID=A0A915E7R0_9BILA
MKKCKVHVNLPLYIVMDRVCELCHDFYSHEKPNMRMECRSNCFRSESYKKCLNLFEPSISSDFSTSELGFSINKSLMR